MTRARRIGRPYHARLMQGMQPAIARSEWRSEVHLPVHAKELDQLVVRRPRRIGRRAASAAVAGTEPSRTSRSSPARRAQNEHARSLAVDAERVRNPHRHERSATRCRARSARSPAWIVSRPSSDDVTLVLRMGVQRWRGPLREEELDQREAAVAGLTGHGDRSRACRRTSAARPHRLLPRSRVRPARPSRHTSLLVPRAGWCSAPVDHEIRHAPRILPLEVPLLGGAPARDLLGLVLAARELALEAELARGSTTTIRSR